MPLRSGEAWNDEDMATLRQMFRAGSKNAEIARALKRTEASAGAGQQDEAPPPVGRDVSGRFVVARLTIRWTEEDKATLRAMIDAGKPRYVIANKLGRTCRAIDHRIKAMKGGPSDVETDT